MRLIPTALLLASLVTASAASFAQDAAKASAASDSVAPTSDVKPIAPKPKKKKRKKLAQVAATPAPVAVTPPTVVSAPAPHESDAEPAAEKTYITANGQPPGGPVDVTGFIGSYALLGWELGGAVGYRILPQGFIPNINNSVWLEAGAYRAHWQLLDDSHDRVDVTGVMRWEFHVHKMWSPYASVGFGYERNWWHGESGYDDVLTPVINVGVMLHLNANLAIRFEYGGILDSDRVGLTVAL